MATYTNLDNEIFANSALQAFVKTLAPLAAFSRNFSAAPVQKGNTVLVPLIAALTATTFGGSYAVCGGTKTVVTVSINRHKVVAIGQDDLTAAGSSEANLIDFAFQQGRALALAVIADVFTLCTTANFGAVTAVASTAMTVTQLRSARLLLNQDNVSTEPRSLILDCVPYDSLLAVTNFVQAQMFADNRVLADGAIFKALGFNMYEVNAMFGSVNSVMGFAVHPSAIAIAMRYLQPQPGNNYSDARAVVDPETGITFGLRDHYDNNTGSRYLNMEANYGYAVGITNAGRLIKQSD